MDSPIARRGVILSLPALIVTVLILHSLLKRQDSTTAITKELTPKKTKKDMSGTKRDFNGNAKKHDGPKPGPKQPVVRNAYTPMFEHLRDELDEHHDRLSRLGKASRDITALSKKM